MFGGQQGRSADNVLQELDGQVLQVRIVLKILQASTFHEQGKHHSLTLVFFVLGSAWSPSALGHSTP